MNAAFPSRFGVGGVTVTQTIALLPPVAITALGDPVSYIGLLFAGLVIILFWEATFAFFRNQIPSFHGITTALIATILVSPDLPIWQLVLVLSLAVTLGELVFGGRGFGFLSPAVVAVSLLVFSFPEVELASGTPILALATVPGALLLLFLGLISWRIILSVSIGTFALLAINGHQVDAFSIAAALSFYLIFLICDPTATAVTNPGRWIYGLLTGLLIVLFSNGPDITTEAIIFAALIASIFAPLIDHLVILTHARR